MKQSRHIGGCLTTCPMATMNVAAMAKNKQQSSMMAMLSAHCSAVSMHNELIVHAHTETKC